MQLGTTCVGLSVQVVICVLCYALAPGCKLCRHMPAVSSGASVLRSASAPRAANPKGGMSCLPGCLHATLYLLKQGHHTPVGFGAPGHALHLLGASRFFFGSRRQICQAYAQLKMPPRCITQTHPFFPFPPAQVATTLGQDIDEQLLQDMLHYAADNVQGFNAAAAGGGSGGRRGGSWGHSWGTLSEHDFRAVFKHFRVAE